MRRNVKKAGQAAQHVLYQVSTATALVEGIYQGAVRVGNLREHGDLGLGTFQDLDGEMVIIDGHCYHVRSDGSVRECDDGALSPFAVITRFVPDQTVTLSQCPDLSHLASRFDALRHSDNFFFALRVDGHFDYVHTRALGRSAEGTPLVQAAVVQPEFELKSVSGTLAGFWTPYYAKPLNVPGYHLHFLSDDHKSGGHLLECRGTNLRLQIQREGDYHLVLPETEDFIKANLSGDPTTDLAKAEVEKKGRIHLVEPSPQTGAGLLVKSLEAQGVEYVFGIAGAKIDKVFDTLLNSKIKTVVCRHEQNAAFIAGGIGRMTGKAGVTLVTSGPGCSNLVTGLATANSEGDPVVAIGGAVARADRLKLIHQSMDTVSLFRPVTKFSAEIEAAEAVSEVLANAFRAAESGRPGAAFISAPQDIMMADAEGEVLTPVAPVMLGPAAQEVISAAAAVISKAERPVLLLGLLASQPRAAEAVRVFLTKTKLPVACTYQGAGVVSKEFFDLFAGRVGLFHNQPADKLIDSADVVVTVGYDPIEYEPSLWNKGRKRHLVHIDAVAADVDKNYRPQIELTGDIAATVHALTAQVARSKPSADTPLLIEIARDRNELAKRASSLNGFPIHPLRLVAELQRVLSEDMTLCLDMGSFHIWLARYLYSFRARQVLITNGQQTLGVALPWAIAACLVRPDSKVMSISGDGGFLFSAGELETAVRLKCNLVHLVWIDGTYNMVGFQEIAKYGRDSGVEFGPVDVATFAEAFGAHGLRIERPEQIGPTLEKALAMQGPVVIGIPVDYRENHELMEMIRAEMLI